MNREELHKLLDMVIDIGKSSKRNATLRISRYVHTVYIYDSITKDIVDQLDIFPDADKISDQQMEWLKQWKYILDKERKDETNKL